MGNTVADFNGDGRLDWYVSSIFSPPSGQHPGTGNKLYLQEADGTFTESAAAAGVDDGGWGWGVLSIDFDHDGLVEIVETNGWDTSEFIGESSYAFRNTGNGQFEDVSVSTGIATHTLQGRGIAAVDFDNDGDQDVVFFGNNDAVRLHRCDLAGVDQNWLRIFLDTPVTAQGLTPLAPNGFGSRVWVEVDGVEQLRSLDGGCNYISQSELSAHFGLGSAASADRVRVDWAHGVTSVFENVPANQVLTLAPGSMTFMPGDCNSDVSLDLADAVLALDLVFQPGAQGAAPCLRACDANSDGVIDVSDAIFTLQALFGGHATQLGTTCVYGDTPAVLSCDAGVGCP